MFIDRVTVAGWDKGQWPFTVPAIRSIADRGLDFEKPVTFLVGENGSGKSTIVEALAQRFGIDNRGGHGGRRYASTAEPNELGKLLSLHPIAAGHRRVKSFFLRAETAMSVFEYMSDWGVTGYGERHAAEGSHGESFLQVLEGRFDAPGLFLLDEPEAPMSFRSCLHLVAVLHRLAVAGGQIICATHSPLLTMLPGAQILELSDQGITERAWEELDLTRNWRDFLTTPDAFLRHLLA